MVRSYTITALRNFRRNPLVSFINLFGLSLGLATCLVAGLFIKHELQADTFHKDLNSIYRATVQMKEYNMSGSPFAFGEAAPREFSQVSSSVRVSDQLSSVAIRDERFNSEVVFADANFFSFFTFPLLQGSSQKALSELQNIVISESMYQKYFEGQNVIGQSIQLQLNDQWKEFQISAIAKAPPYYSSIQFDFLVPLANHPQYKKVSSDPWGSFFYTTFLKVDQGKIETLEQAMPAFLAKHNPDALNSEGVSTMNIKLAPFGRHHLSEGFPGGGLKQGRSSQSLWVFGGIALVILLLACFNFMNLTNAQSSRRAVEVGIRKVVGAGRAQLIPQFLFEAFIISAFAAILALGVAELCLLVFQDLFGASLSVFHIGNADILSGLIGITIIAGLLAGIYPALVLSNLPALQTFKRYFRIGGNNLVTRGILSFQFSLSIILIVCAIVMWRQQQYMMNKDLGYNKEQLLVVPFKSSDTSSVDFIKNEVLKLPQVVLASKTSGAFTRGNSATLQTLPDKSRFFIYMQSIDEDYIKTMEMEIVKGEGFSTTLRNDASKLMVNEALMKKLDLEDSIGVPLGRSIGHVDHPTVVGVVKDFHHSQLRYEIGPLMLLNSQRLEGSYLMIRLSQNKVSAGLKNVEAIWNKANPDSPFDYFFLDDDLRKQYESEQRWSKIISLATGMAIFLSILGLLGLAMFTAERRKKEVGIRKVLGASFQQLLMLLSKGYLWLILISFIVAAPVSYYIMTKYWLETFVYRISFEISIYLIAMVAVVLIAALAIGSQMIRAAMQNPADILKEE